MKQKVLTFSLFVAALLNAQQTSVSESTTIKTAKLDDGTEVSVDVTSKVTVKAGQKGLRRKTAIFVRNEAGATFASASKRIQTQLTAQVSGEHFEILDPQDIIYALAPLMEGLDMADGTKQALKEEAVMELFAARMGKANQPTANGRGATQDEKLRANTSPLRLAQNMDADYVLILSLDKFDKSKKTYKSKDLDAPLVTELYTLSASYRVLDGYTGASIGGGTLKATKSYRQTANIQIEPGEYADGLDEQMAEKLASDMKKNATKWREASLAASGIPVKFNVFAYNMDNTPIYLPVYDGQKKVLNETVPAQIEANIEVDGITLGTTPCTTPMTPGLHKVRFTRKGYDDVSMTVKPMQDMSLAVSMRMTEGESGRLRETIDFMHKITMERELNQAQVERLKGEAQMLRQSGFKIDSKKAPDTIMKSLF
ncbi:MAG: PEGA domain-containing protein [bacterium]